jgi:DNA ligase D
LLDAAQELRRVPTMSSGIVVPVAGRQVKLSNPDKVYFSARHETKVDLVRYYASVEGPMMHAVGGRPALLQRFPDGAEGKSFFQKRVPPGAPEWLQTTVVSTPNGTTSRALVLADLAHVIWAVNLGCIGFHVWPYVADDPGHVDELRIDLDPQPGVSFADVGAAARHAHQLLGELGIVGHPKTTGSRGLHIYVRLESRWDAIAVRQAAVALARELERREPELITASWWKEERGKRVFVDFNQNAPHKTVFGAWSVRARPGAQVSMPLLWSEVDSVEPDELTITRVPKLMEGRDDPWAGIDARSQSIEPLLDMYEGDREAGLPDAPWPPVYPKQPDEEARVAPSRARRPRD